MKILLANPRFCAGVDRAITIVKNARINLAPIHVRHEVVHNKYVVMDELKSMGAIFVDELAEIP